MSNLYDALLKDMPKAAFRLDSAGTAYEDATGNGNTLTGTLAFSSSLVNGNSKALAVNTANMVGTSTSVFLRGGESRPFSLEAWVLPTTFTGTVSILSHTGVYDGLAFDGNNIRFRIGYATLGNAEVSWPVPDFPEAVHVCATYSRDKIQLYINRSLEAELELTDAQFADGFAAEPSALLYCGQSASGTERLVVDGIAIFNNVLSRERIGAHFLYGRNVPTTADIVGQNGGFYFDGPRRDIALQQLWSTTADWKTGRGVDVGFASGTLVPLFDSTTDLSFPGVWNGSLGLGAVTLATISGIKALWNGDGVFTVEYSFDGTTYATLTNGQLVPTTIGLDPLDKVMDLRITFTGGVLLDIAEVRDITLVVYSTNIVRGSESSRNLLLTGTVSTALDSNEPIERNSAAGITFYGGYGVLTSDLSAGTVRTNLAINPAFEVDVTTGWSIDAPCIRTLETVTPISGTGSVKLTGGGEFYITQSMTASVPVTISLLCRSEGTLIGYPRLLAQPPSGFGDSVFTIMPNDVDASVRYSLTVTPTTTGTGYVGVSLLTMDPADVIYVDSVLVEESAVAGTYFDGEGGVWTGTAHASTSLDVVYTPRNIAALEFWINPSQVTAASTIFDARPAATPTANIATGLLSYAGHSAVYVNGAVATSGTAAVVVGQWTHIMYVPTAPFDLSTLIGVKNTTLDELFSGQMGLIGVYAVAPTAAQALATYNAYSHLPLATATDTGGIEIAELSSAYTNYALDWSVTGASI